MKCFICCLMIAVLVLPTLAVAQSKPPALSSGVNGRWQERATAASLFAGSVRLD